MANIIIDSHDFLGKLSTIKNYLFTALEAIPKSKQANHHQQAEKWLRQAYRANEELIKMVKKSTSKSQKD